jgi:hypothetical protein
LLTADGWAGDSNRAECATVRRAAGPETLGFLMALARYLKSKFGPRPLKLKLPGMNWVKVGILALLIVTAVVAAHYWRKGAGNVVLPLTLVGSYAVWR